MTWTISWELYRSFLGVLREGSLSGAELSDFFLRTPTLPLDRQGQREFMHSLSVSLSLCVCLCLYPLLSTCLTLSFSFSLSLLHPSR